MSFRDYWQIYNIPTAKFGKSVIPSYTVTKALVYKVVKAITIQKTLK